MIRNPIKNDKGFTLGELLVVFGILLAVGLILAPVVRYNQIRLSRINCANNLRQTGLAMYIYAREHGGKFPPTVQTLYDEQYLSDERLRDCPANRAPEGEDWPDYTYNPGLSVRSDSATVLLSDRTGNHPGHGGNVLLVDGRVEWKEDL